jgi:hypothetical protein
LAVIPRTLVAYAKRMPASRNIIFGKDMVRL